MKRLIFIMLLICGYHVLAQEVSDSVKIYFRQGYSNLDMSIPGNFRALNRISDSLKTSYADSIFQLQKILVVGSASPEGNISLNRQLSEKRAKVLFEYLSHHSSLPDSLKEIKFVGRNWNGLIRLVEDDENVPYKKESLKLLREIAVEAERGITSKGDHLKRIRQLREGVPYWYMYKNLFPELRVSQLYLWYVKEWNPIVSQPETKTDTMIIPPIDTTTVHDAIKVEMTPPIKPFHMAIKTNMLYDILLVPNVGVEFYLGKKWSITAGWMYSWWKNDHHNYYWRTYGGDIELRRWFGRKAKEKPLTGHHIGLYGQILTYDFELGGRGYLGDRWSYAAGISYGYSQPIAKQLNIDFTIGIGYLTGEYKEYAPSNNCYVWQSTKQRRWFGPTKAEVSLVWLLGRDNYNHKKGGRR